MIDFNDYFKVTIHLLENPYFEIKIFKNELEYEMLKLWKDIRSQYHLTDDKILITNNLIYRIDFKNDKDINFYRNIGLFCSLLMKSSDLLRKEIVEKEKILKRTLK